MILSDRFVFTCFGRNPRIKTRKKIDLPLDQQDILLAKTEFLYEGWSSCQKSFSGESMHYEVCLHCKQRGTEKYVS